MSSEQIQEYSQTLVELGYEDLRDEDVAFSSDEDED